MSKSARLITEQQKSHRPSTPATHTGSTQHPLLRLQHDAGNHAVQQAATTPVIQTKLSVNPPGDIYEQEADSIAADIIQEERSQSSDVTNNAGIMRQEVPEEEELLQAKYSSDFVQRQEEEEEEIQAKHSADFVQRQEEEELVMAKPSHATIQRGMPGEEKTLSHTPSPDALYRQIEEEEEEMQAKHGPDFIQRQEEEEEEEAIQTKASDHGVSEVDRDLESRIDAAHGGGERLPSNISSSFESHMGADLSGVRVHTGAEAHSLSRSVQAEAFTTGNDIFFRSGRYNPDSDNGRELLAHEVTHVVQQGAAPTMRKEEQ